LLHIVAYKLNYLTTITFCWTIWTVDEYRWGNNRYAI